MKSSSYQDEPTTPTVAPWEEPHIIESFDVTCVIGTVRLGGTGPSPYQAAFALIADNGGEGVFSFPLGGRIVHVNVESEPDPAIPGPKPKR